MALKQSKEVAGKLPVPSLIDQRVMPVTGTYTVKTGDASGDIVELGGIPPNTKVVDLVIHHDGVGGTVDAGILSGEYGAADSARTIGQEFAAAAATAAAGVVRMTKSAVAVASDTAERGWGVKFLAAPVVGKVIEATLLVRPA